MVYPEAWAAASACTAFSSVMAVCGLKSAVSEASGSEVPVDTHVAWPESEQK